MYCKHCGKQIADDSTFCQYCGGKVDALAQESKEDSVVEQTEKPAETDKETAEEVVITTKEAQPLQVEVSKKTKDNSSTIANEIVGNLKMVGFALIGWFVFMIGFIAFHQKDIKQHPDSYWGESCYDESYTTGNYGSFDWKEILAEYKRYRTNERNGLMWDGRRSPYGNMPQIKIYDRSDEELEKDAKEEAEKNKASFSEYINSNRQWSFEEDRNEKAKYSAIILLALFIVGRYLIKLTKWVGENKTE